MKKNMMAAVLGIALVAGIIGTNVLKVSADQGTESPLGENLEFAEEAPEEAIAEIEMEESEGTILEEENVENPEEMENSESEVKEEAEQEEITGMKVILENNLDADVISVEISSFSGEAFSENLLLNDMVLRVNDSCTIGIPEAYQDHELGMYNVRVTMVDGTVTEIPFVPFLEDVRGTLYRQNETVLIQIRDPRLEAEVEVISEAEIMQKEAEASQSMAEALAEEIE